MLCDHLVDYRDRQTFQQRDTLAQGRLEGDFAAHGAFGDRRDVVLQPGKSRQFVDAFLSDHGGIHVGEEQLLAAVGGRLHDNVERTAEGRAERVGERALVGARVRGKGDVGGVPAPSAIRLAGAGSAPRARQAPQGVERAGARSGLQ